METIIYRLAANFYPDYPDPMPDFRYLDGKGLLESALAEPRQTFGGRYLHRTIFDKAAALLCSIIKNHALMDGNKRTGLATVSVFLALNQYLFHPAMDEAIQYCVRTAETPGKGYQREVARWIRAKAVSYKKIPLMPLGELGDRMGEMKLEADLYLNLARIMLEVAGEKGEGVTLLSVDS